MYVDLTAEWSISTLALAWSFLMPCSYLPSLFYWALLFPHSLGPRTPCGIYDQLDTPLGSVACSTGENGLI